MVYRLATRGYHVADACRFDVRADLVHGKGQSVELEHFTEIPERAMVVCAHPDDAEIGAGGTTSLWARNGCEISYVVCTTGSSGSNDEAMTSEKIVDIRRREQADAADVIGVTNLVMLPYPDGMLETSREFLGDIVKAIRTYRPVVIFTHDPFRFDGFNHRDHRNTGMTVQDAVYPYARDHLHFPEQLEEGLEPHIVSDVFFWHADEPNVIVDITSSIDTRIDALSKHVSQVPGLSRQSGSDRGIRDRAKSVAEGFEFEYGEAFRRISARRRRR